MGPHIKRYVLFWILFGLTIASIVYAGGSRGEWLFYNANPSCGACHNAKRGDLSESYISRARVIQTIQDGRIGEMPAYPLNEDDLNALADYVVSIRQ
jgi:mono/diheme cytochrome c family protein